MQERFCQPQAAAEADHRDPAHQQQEANPVAEKKKKALDGEVTGHLDVDEKSFQQPGATVLKTWKVKNTGKEAWCEDTIAVFNSGNHSLVVPGYDVIQVGALEPNDVAYIRCMLTVPEMEGTYNVTYRLSGPKGKFGVRLTTEIEVAKPVEEAWPQPAEPSVPRVAPSAPVVPEKKFQWQKQKDQLKAMGFEMDDETLESVLIVSKGDIGQAIQLLM